MTYLIITLIILFLIGFGSLFYFLNHRLAKIEEKKKEDQSILMLNQSLQGMQRTINERLDKAAEVIAQVTKELGSMREIGHQMQSLQDFLKSPKLRGNIGEQVLQDLLEQYFSRHHFELQYKFRSGERVDAILKTKEGIIPIDAKFPMENFRKLVTAKNDQEKKEATKLFIRDVKKHIDDISKKYILPQEGTVDFAVMYIPSETIYYEIIRKAEQIDDYARKKRVYFVSPNSFYYFLRVIMIGMRGQQIQEGAKKIFQILSAVQKDAEKLGEILNVANTHITNAKNALDRVNNEYTKMIGKIDQVKLLK
ncbi:DNA recombination protein RmuC [bacterium]|nr:DNA recombination protein RmuC [bacterium]